MKKGYILGVSYRVLIDSNFHYQDESERATHGVFETAEEAVTACKAILDGWLTDAFKPGTTSEDLWQSYVAFGDDPWVQAVDPKDAPAGNFSAWDYVREQCEVLARGAVDP